MVPPLLQATLLASIAAPQESPGRIPSFLRWFVAPDGNDAWDGLAPKRDGGSGPFRTPRRALDALKSAKVRGSLPAPVLIELLPGTYFLDEPLVVTPDHCGGPRLSVFPVPSADPGVGPAPRVVLSGGRRIDGWRRETIDGRELFVADVPAAKDGGWRFRELWIDGERRPRAREPDSGFFAVDALDEADAAKPWNEGVSAFRFGDADADALRTVQDADLTIMCRWVESHVRVASVDLEARRVALREPTVFKLDPGDPWYLEGARAFLDSPGEWWLDESAGRLHVVPLEGEDLAKREVIAPRLDHLLEVEGTLARSVSGVSFENLVFAHCEWWFEPPADPSQPRASGFPQAAVGVPAAVRVRHANDVVFDGCSVQHVGGYGLELGRGCTEVSWINGEFADLGAGGVKIGERAISGERATRNTIRGCAIRDGGRVFHSAVGIWIGQSPGNRIVRNEIRDFYYTGLSIGWTWGYGEADAGGQHVAENEIHHVGRRSDGSGPILSDLGGIYTLGAQDHTSLTRNWIHDVAARTYGGWGIYLDEGTSRLHAADNLVTRTTHGGFHQHYGRDNVVERNVFAYGRDAQIQRTRAEPHSSFTFRRNVVLFREGDVLAGDFSDGRFLLEENLYWRDDGGEPRFAGHSFDEWQALGFDRGSSVGDPRFVAPANDDWSIGNDSPARPLLSIDAFGTGPLAPTIPWALAVTRPRNR